MKKVTAIIIYLMLLYYADETLQAYFSLETKGKRIDLVAYLVISFFLPLFINMILYRVDKESKLNDFVGKILNIVVIILYGYQFIEPNNTSLVTTGWIDFFRYLISFTVTWFIAPYLYKMFEYLWKNVRKVMIWLKNRRKTKNTTTSNESIEKVDNLACPTRDEEWYYQ